MPAGERFALNLTPRTHTVTQLTRFALTHAQLVFKDEKTPETIVMVADPASIDVDYGKMIKDKVRAETRVVMRFQPAGNFAGTRTKVTLTQYFDLNGRCAPPTNTHTHHISSSLTSPAAAACRSGS